jgi:hypothetical protein
MPKALTAADVPIGTRYGRWTTTSAPYVDGEGRHRMSWVDLICDCGTEQALPLRDLRFRRNGSCGCLKRETSIRNLGNPRFGPDHPNWLGGNSQKARRAWFDVEKNHLCQDCGERFPSWCMEFDHVPGRGPKLFNIALNTIEKYSIEELKTERAKCDLVCACCHNTRTHLRPRSRMVLAV